MGKCSLLQEVLRQLSSHYALPKWLHPAPWLYLLPVGWWLPHLCISCPDLPSSSLLDPVVSGAPDRWLRLNRSLTKLITPSPNPLLLRHPSPLSSWQSCPFSFASQKSWCHLPLWNPTSLASGWSELLILGKTGKGGNLESWDKASEIKQKA